MNFNPETGLTAQQYQRNMHTYGKNVLPEVRPPTRLQILLSQFKSPLIYILFLAGGLTLALGDIVEAIGIWVVVVVNSIFGFFQENKAEATLASLRNTLKPHCMVVRNGKHVKILSSELTVGDVIILKLGDKVPADGVLLSGTGISINEAVLTGESEAVEKSLVSDDISSAIKSNGFLDHKIYQDLADAHKLFMGTSVMSGYGYGLVTHVGVHTAFGKIADSIFTQSDSKTPLQIRIGKFSTTLTKIILAITLFMFVWGLLHEIELLEILELSISVAVSAVPEGLVVALTVILALGMNRILKRRAIVRKLVAAETLGSVSTICVDKTGTLTEGKMRVVNTYLSDENMTKRALLATNHQVNAVEVSLQNWLENRLTAHDKVTFQQEEYLELKIFDSKTKFSATLGGENLYCVGAPEIVLAKTTLSAKQKEKWLEQFREFSLKGMRLVAVAYKSRADGDSDIPTTALPAGLTWLGLIVLEDPVRPNLFSVFKATADAGIAIKVITGDFGETAQAVLRKIGIEVDEIEMMSGRELGGLSDSQLAHQVTKIRLFYRTTPDQKLRIVNALQAQDEVVAMMGDGINDTPALKKADIGIVVDNATDFSKEVADIVLLDSNFQTIIAAVEEGRSIFENMRKVLAYLLADAFDAIVLVVGSLVIGLPTPMLPLQILYINFLADGLPDLALAFEKPEGAVMRDKPRPKKFPLLDREVKTLVFIIGIVITSLVFILYVFMLGQGLEIEFIRTFIFATVGIDSLFYVFSIKTFRRNIWKENFLNNRFLNIGVSIGILSMVAAVYVPFLQDILDTVAMPLWAWGVILLKSVLSILAIEVIKWKFMRNNI